MSIGEAIIQEIIKQRMFTVSHPDPDEAHVFVWSSGAAEQLEALVHNHAVVEIPKRCMRLFAEALRIAGAPDAENPHELIAWAKAVANSQPKNRGGA